MKDLKKIATYLLVSWLILQVGCSSSPPEVEGEDVQVVHSQKDDREGLEEAFEVYLLTTEIAPDVYAQNPEALGEATDKKVREQQALADRLRSIRDSSSLGSEDHDWASLRLAQTYLNMGCELNRVEPPQDLTDSQAAQFRQSLQELTAPLFVEANELILSFVGDARSEWAVAGQSIAGAFRDHRDDGDRLCGATEAHWKA